MKPVLGKSVRLFLMDGISDGRWICELSNWTGKAYKIPRSMLGQSKNREDLKSTGVYLLLGRSDELGGKNRVYIGEAENIYERLKQHAAGKDFWFEAIIYLSKDEYLNKAHIKYLESRLYEISQKVDRFAIENTSTPTRSKISEAEQAEMEEFLQHIVMLTSILGHKVFESLSGTKVETQTEAESFILDARGVKAHGYLGSDGFVVFQGSEAAKDLVKSCSPWVERFREKMLSEGVIALLEGKLIYKKNYLFATPSGAAVVTLGRNTNGWTAWKTKEGKTLKDMEASNE